MVLAGLVWELRKTVSVAFKERTFALQLIQRAPSQSRFVCIVTHTQTQTCEPGELRGCGARGAQGGAGRPQWA